MRKLIESIIYNIQFRIAVNPKEICLITGSPRSGTSAGLYWLGEHKKVIWFYESRILVASHKYLKEVERFINLSENQTRILKILRNQTLRYYGMFKLLWGRVLIDKEPLEPIAFSEGDYKEFIDHFRFLFPKSKIIFMFRDPVATIWSMTQRKWGYSLKQKTRISYSIEESVANWNACAEAGLNYAEDKNFFFCHFDRLISDSKEMSKQIFHFLGLNSANYFKPKQTKVSAFSLEEKEFIITKTKHNLDRLLKVSM